VLLLAKEERPEALSKESSKKGRSHEFLTRRAGKGLKANRSGRNERPSNPGPPAALGVKKRAFGQLESRLSRKSRFEGHISSINPNRARKEWGGLGHH